MATVFSVCTGCTLVSGGRAVAAPAEESAVEQVLIERLARRYGGGGRPVVLSRTVPLVVSQDSWAFRLDPRQQLPADLLPGPAPRLPAELLAELSARAAASVRWIRPAASPPASASWSRACSGRRATRTGMLSGACFRRGSFPERLAPFC